MAATYIEEIRALAEKCDGRDTTLYFPDFNADPGPGALSRVGGPPVGVDARTWPRCAKSKLQELIEETGDGWDGKDLRMEHVFTLDLAGIGQAIGAPEGARAMSLFISNAGFNEASQPGNDETIVLFLGEEDCARGPYKGELPARSKEREGKRFVMVPVEVPSRIFSLDDDEEEGEEGEGSDDGERATLEALREAVFNAPAYLGGEPMWVQGDPDEEELFDDDEGDDDEGDEDEVDEDEGDEDEVGEEEEASERVGLPGPFGYVMQFDEKFASVNLGDSGVMYVFGTDAYWQCY